MKIPQIDKKIFQKFNVKLAYLFGSQAKGNAAAESDFDLAVLFEEAGDKHNLFEKTLYLAEELRDYFPKRIDIVSLNDAPLLLKYEVVSNGQALYCANEAERIDFEVLIIKEYIDEEPLRNLYNQGLYKRILQGA